MPITVQTRYDIPRLHKVFAGSAITLLIVTIAMFLIDHQRQWKQIQRKGDRIERQMAGWRRLQYLTEDVQSERNRLEEALASLKATPLSPALLAAFKAELKHETDRTGRAVAAMPQFDESIKRVTLAAAEVTQLQDRCAQLGNEAKQLATRIQSRSEQTASLDNEPEPRHNEIDSLKTRARDKKKEAEAASTLLKQAKQTIADRRDETLAIMREMTADAKFREDESLRKRKFESAHLDVVKGEYSIAVREDRSAARLATLLAEIKEYEQRVAKRTRLYEAASVHHERLQRIVRQLTGDQRTLEDRRAEMLAEQQRLERVITKTDSKYFRFHGVLPVPGRKWLELPFLDAFNSPRKIKNLWSDGLEIRLGSFGHVRRFDRCTTCHGAVDKTLSGSATELAYQTEVVLRMALAVPEERPEILSDEGAETRPIERQLREIFGIQLSDHGLVNSNHAAVTWIRPGSPASQARPNNGNSRDILAKDALSRFASGRLDLGTGSRRPGLLVGDVIVAINGHQVASDEDPRDWIAGQLLHEADLFWKASDAGDHLRGPIQLTVQRGLLQPYASHPRLDLFVGPASPHKISDFACTVCHEGQGSATDFRWASHTPNDPETRARWHTQYGWFNNVHWPYPMHARRLIESTCLKCHHDIMELDASDRFPDAPAPKVVGGYRLIQQFGCFGCHQINGFDGPNRRIGPDLRTEPAYSEAALQLKGKLGTGYENLTQEEKSWIEQIIVAPEQAEVRHRILAMLAEDAALAAPRNADTILATVSAGTPIAEPKKESGKKEQPRLSSYVHQRLMPLFQDQEVPGTLRKPGPSLRFIGSKLDKVFLYDWIRKPNHFRPTTRMPQYFGLWNHLSSTVLRAKKKSLEQQRERLRQDSGDVPQKRLGKIEAELRNIDDQLKTTDDSEQRFEPIEIYSMVMYLLQRSQPFQFLTPPVGITPVQTAAEKQAQIERGKIVFQQRGCLACHSHRDFPEMESHRGTGSINRGPDLSDIGSKLQVSRNPNGPKWLYSWIKNPTSYHARSVMPNLFLDPIQHRNDTEKVTRVTDPAADVVAYLLKNGRTDWAPDPAPVLNFRESDRRALEALALEYLRGVFREDAARAYLRDGIPASRRAELRGAELELIVPEDRRGKLTDEAMMEKRISYVAGKSFLKHGCFGCHDIPGFEDAKPIGIGLNDWGTKDPTQLAFHHVAQYLRNVAPTGRTVSAKKGSNPIAQPSAASPIPPFYLQQIDAEDRIGFIFQKLTEPRSFDYRVSETKGYNERLRMPRFPLTVDQREQIVTFVLGLIADPPSDKYVYAPNPGRQAIAQGKMLIEKYSCQACHVLETEKWRIAFPPDDYGPQEAPPTFPFVKDLFSQQQRAASLAIDRGGHRTAIIEGFPSIDESGKPRLLDDEEFPVDEEDDEPYNLDLLILALDLWKPAMLDGQPYQVGDVPLLVPTDQIESHTSARGGDLARYLLPCVVQDEKKLNPSAKGSEAWGWLPPPLIGEGNKLQPNWLHNYLLDPVPIRPAVVMRMPQFNMSPREATVLVNYFAAIERAVYPYDFNRSQRKGHLEQADSLHAQRLKTLVEAGKFKTNSSLANRRLADAMKILTDSNYCVKCHIVGDFQPVSSDRAKAPDLSAVEDRLRIDYLRKWLAKPNAKLPYTSMPVNFTYDQQAPNLGSTISQQLYHGDSIEQLDAVADLLMNFSRFANQRAPIAPLVKPTPNTDATEGP